MTGTLATANEAVNKPGQAWITLTSLQTLRPGVYLNDEAIITYMRLLNTRDKFCTTETETRPCHCFLTFLITTLLQSDNGQAAYNNVQNWSRHVPGKSLFLVDKIIFPINVNGNHWVCVLVSIHDRKIQYHDPLGGKGRIFLESPQLLMLFSLVPTYLSTYLFKVTYTTTAPHYLVTGLSPSLLGPQPTAPSKRTRLTVGSSSVRSLTASCEASHSISHNTNWWASGITLP
jgi:Ulp1 family protease